MLEQYPNTHIIVCSADPSWRVQVEGLSAQFIEKTRDLAVHILAAARELKTNGRDR